MESSFLIAIVGLFAAGSVVSSWLLPTVARWAIRHGLIDLPDSRRIHQSPIPRAGGLAVFVGTNIAAMFIWLLPDPLPFHVLSIAFYLRFLLGSAIVVIMGLIDDMQGLAPRFKISAQAIAALVVFSAGARFSGTMGIELPVAIDLPLTMGWLLLVTNALNLIDGLDGLAAGIAAIAAIGLAYALSAAGMPGDALLLCGFVGASVGFLRYNLHPAKLFLGDTGSNYIGFFLGTMAIVTFRVQHEPAGLAMPILALSVPLLDTALAIWRRTIRGAVEFLGHRRAQSGVLGADLDHLHHRLLRKGMSQPMVAASLHLANAAAVLAGVLILAIPEHSGLIFLSACAAGAGLAAAYVPMPEVWETGRAVVHALVRPTKPRLTLAIFVVLDVAAVALSLLLATILTLPGATSLYIMRTWSIGVFTLLPLVAAPLLAIEVWTRLTHRRQRDAVVLFGLCFVIAGTGSYGFHQPSNDARFMSLFLLFAALSTISLRLLPRVVHRLMVYRLSSSVLKVLVCGTGEACERFLIDACSLARTERTRVVGLVEPGDGMKKRQVMGYPVLGGLDDISNLVRRHGIEGIVVAGVLPADVERTVHELAAQYGIPIVSSPSESPDHSAPAAPL